MSIEIDMFYSDYLCCKIQTRGQNMSTDTGPQNKGLQNFMYLCIYHNEDTIMIEKKSYGTFLPRL